MREYGDLEHIYSHTTNIRTKQEDIADILGNSGEYMEKHTIQMITRLAQLYYGTEKEMKYSAYTEKTDPDEDDLMVNHKEYLYILTQYKGKDLLLHIGTGEFSPEVFTRRDISQLRGFSHSPLPLFIIPARAVQEYPREDKEIKHRHMIVRRFLEENTIIYSPKGGMVETYESNDPDHHIDLGKTNGILHHEDVMIALQDVLIQKLCTKENDRQRFLNEIISLQTFSKHEFTERLRGREKYYNDDQKGLLYLLENMVERDHDAGPHEYSIHNNRMTKIYTMIKTFDTERLKNHDRYKHH